MSKVDAQRAMKAARHARTPAPATPAPARPAPARPARGASPASPVAAPAASDAAPAASDVAATADGTGAPAAAPGTADGAPLCGHRNMAGKDCRRPAGHPEKSHRYS